MSTSGDPAWHLLGIVLTDACNLHCAYCRVARGGRRCLPWPALQESLDALLPSAGNDVDVTFTGGEPLLAFAILRQAVAYVEQRIAPRRVGWHLLTNGLLLDAATLAFLDARGFLLNLSFDGVPDAQALRGPSTYARLDALLDHLRDAYNRLFEDRLKVCATLAPRTVRYLSDSVSYFVEKGVRTLELSAALGMTDWEVGRIDELEQQFERVSRILLRHFEQTNEVPLVLFRKSAEPEPELSEWTCLVAEGRNPTIDVDGRIYGCLRATGTYQPHTTHVMRPAVRALALGRPQAAQFADAAGAMHDAAVAAGAFQHPERRYSSYRRCADCEFLERCRICPLACASVPGWDDMYRVPDFLCAFNQVALAHRARFPVQPTADDFLSGRVPIPKASGARVQLS